MKVVINHKILIAILDCKSYSRLEKPESHLASKYDQFNQLPPFPATQKKAGRLDLKYSVLLRLWFSFLVIF